jgi:hypothetical protein
MTTQDKTGDQSSSQIRSGFIRNNLDTCFVFAALAKHEVEAGMRGPAERAFGCAQCSYEAIVRFLNMVEDQEQRKEVQNKLIQLGEGLEFLRRELTRTKAA